MFARGRVAAGVAGLRLAAAAGLVGAGVLADRAGVDRAEGRGGEGDEHGRVSGDAGVTPLPPISPARMMW